MFIELPGDSPNYIDIYLLNHFELAQSYNNNCQLGNAEKPMNGWDCLAVGHSAVASLPVYRSNIVVLSTFEYLLIHGNCKVGPVGHN